MPLSLKESVETVCDLAEKHVLDEHAANGDWVLLGEIIKQKTAIANLRALFAGLPCTDEGDQDVTAKDDQQITVDLLDGEDHYLVDYAIDKVSSMFDCHAFDVYNAMEQCSEAHPGCFISRVYLITRLK